jgi:hypothetical protein
MPPDPDGAGSSEWLLRRFLADSSGVGINSGDGQGVDLSAPAPLPAAAVDLDELTDRVVRRIERRVIDELERRGRSGARRTF